MREYPKGSSFRQLPVLAEEHCKDDAKKEGSGSEWLKVDDSVNIVAVAAFDLFANILHFKAPQAPAPLICFLLQFQGGL